MAMALVRDRRPHLTIDLPSSAAAAAAAAAGAECRMRFHPPRRPESPSTSGCSDGEFRLCDLERLGVLGNGNGGTVYKVRHRPTGALYALKTLLHAAADSGGAAPSRGGGGGAGAAAAREVEILRRTDSPSVVRCHAVFSTPSDDKLLLLELMDGGSLDSVLRGRGGRPFPEAALAEVAAQALRGLSYLHSLKIVHRDIKPSNLLASSRGQIKIADFGVGKILRRTLDSCATYVGTTAYMSPERFDPETYGGDYDPYAADVWSLGLAILELRLGYFPLLPAGQRPDWAALMCAICFGEQPPQIPDDADASPHFRSFVAACLQKESARRASVADLLAHPFVAARHPDDSARALRRVLADSQRSPSSPSSRSSRSSGPGLHPPR